MAFWSSGRPKRHAPVPALHRWDDTERDIDLVLDGYRTLRFPAWPVRKNPGYVARRMLEALSRSPPPDLKIAT
jgi:very-short-patch-repair endonuclease